MCSSDLIGCVTTARKPVRYPVPVELLENLRCHVSDEYPVVACDDEAAIPPLACSFSRGLNTSHILALVDENGTIRLYNTNLAGENAIITDWTAHSNAVFDVEWSHSEHKLLTASGDQTLCLWDVNCQKKLLTCKGHTSSVRSVKYRPMDNAVFASGSRDGHVRIWDSRCNIKEDRLSSVNVIKNAHSVSQQNANKKRKSRSGPAQSQDSQQSVTCVAFQNDHLLTSSGAVDGCVKVWDIRKIKPENNAAVYSFPYTGLSRRTHGFSSLTFDSYFTKLFANCTDDVIYCFDFISYNPEPVCTYRGHRNTTFYVKSALSPDNVYLLSGSSDELAYIWKVDSPNSSPVILKGHRSEVSDVAWCKRDLFRIVTTSDDNTMRVWRLDMTVQERKKLGRSDQLFGIVGSAERTHRDIGTSVESAPQTPKRSPQSALKRSASAPFGMVTETTPKQAKTSLSSNLSPSIKMWLKRSTTEASLNSLTATESVCRTGACIAESETNEQKCSGGDKTKEINSEKEISGFQQKEKSCFRGQKESTKSLSSGSALETIREDTDSNKENETRCSPLKKPKLESAEQLGALVVKDGGRKSCKRKLVHEDTSPPQTKKFRTSKRESDENCNSNGLEDEVRENLELRSENSSPDKRNSQSPKKDDVLKDTKSKVNASPVKVEQSAEAFCSPARIKINTLNVDSYQSPTANLPNLVVDGPQRSVKSLQDESEKKKTVDWLTEMRIQKMAGQSPRVKKNRVKFGECVDTSVPENTVGSVLSVKVKAPSPVRGVKSITSFFRLLEK